MKARQSATVSWIHHRHHTHSPRHRTATMVSTRLIVLAISGSALADFWIGNCASYGAADKTEIALPGEELDCNYKAFPDGEDICTATAVIDTSNNGGVCPGNDDNRSLSFCGIALTGSGCPDSFQISTCSHTTYHPIGPSLTNNRPPRRLRRRRIEGPEPSRRRILLRRSHRHREEQYRRWPLRL